MLTALYPSLLRFPIAMLTVRDKPIKADLIVILSQNSVDRTLWARDLYDRGLAPKILLIPDRPKPLRRELEKIGIKRPRYPYPQRILMASGVPISVIDKLQSYAENTKHETRLIGAYASNHAAKSILLVTSPINSHRACRIFKSNIPSVHFSCQPTPYDQPVYDRKLILRVVNEYLKNAANVVGIN